MIAAAITVILVAGLIYLRGVAPAPRRELGPATFPMLSGPYSATYDFVTPSLGWALVLNYSAFSTNFWIFRTTDGTNHWQEQYVGKAEGGRTYLHFFDDQHGFAYAGFSYRTVDGGAHWDPVDAPGSLPYITFASATLGWALGFDVGSQHLYMTADGGVTWTRLPTELPASAVLEPIFEIQSSAFRDTGEGWLGAGYLEHPIVYLTLDSGAKWRTMAIPSPQMAPAGLGYLTSVRLVPGGEVVVLVSDSSAHVLGAVFSADRGDSWRAVAFPVAVTTSDQMSFLDANHWWTLRSGQIYKTADAGVSWARVAVSGLPDGWSYEGARVIDAHHAWWAMVSRANSTRSALAMSSDGGGHWRMVNVPTP